MLHDGKKEVFEFERLLMADLEILLWCRRHATCNVGTSEARLNDDETCYKTSRDANTM